jgi:hypothetical protein
MFDKLCDFGIDYFNWIMNTIILLCVLTIVWILSDINWNQSVYEIKVIVNSIKELPEVLDGLGKTIL